MTLKTRRLIVTLPNASGEDSDTIASMVEDYLHEWPATVTHALGETLPDDLRIRPRALDNRLAVSRYGDLIRLTPYEARQLAGALLAIPGVAEAEPPGVVPENDEDDGCDWCGDETAHQTPRGHLCDHCATRRQCENDGGANDPQHNNVYDGAEEYRLADGDVAVLCDSCHHNADRAGAFD